MSDGSFVGREDELAKLAELLAPEGALVSLVGPPGVGTSRLGREVAARFARRKIVPASALLKVRTTDVEALDLLMVDDVGALVLAVLEELEPLREAAPALRVLVVGDEALGVADEQVVELDVLLEHVFDPSRSRETKLDVVWDSLTGAEQHALAIVATFAAPAQLEEIDAMIDAPAGVDSLVALETLVRRHLVLGASHRLTLAPVLGRYLQVRTRSDARFTGLAARHAEVVRARREVLEQARTPSTKSSGWQLPADAAQVVAPDGSRVDLRTRPVLRRILAALVARRVVAPGQALDVEGILAAGWPGERVQKAAGVLRVYTAVKRLRAVGLANLVCTAEDGYLLDAAVPVTVSAAALAP
jgi:hypothetical protein